MVGSDCVDDAVVHYLVANALPDEGTVCRPVASPFATGAADQSRTAAQQPFESRPRPAF